MFTLAKSVDGISFCNMQERLQRHRSGYTIPRSEQPVSHSQRRDSRKPRYLLEAQCLANDPRDMTPERLVLADFGTGNLSCGTSFCPHSLITTSNYPV